MDGAVLFYFPFPGSAIGEKKPGTVFSSRKLSPTKAPNASVRARRREPREYRPGSLRGFREGELSTPFHKYGCIRAPPHPLPLRCAPCAVLLRVRLSRAPRWRGASTLSVQHRIYEAEHLGHAAFVRNRDRGDGRHSSLRKRRDRKSTR